MYAPKLYDLEISRDTIQEFRGYNHNLRIGDNEFFDMKNLTGKYYPVLSPRNKRGVYYNDGGDIEGIIAKDELVTIRDNDVFYGNQYIFTLVNPDHAYNERQLISMGAYVIIFPDMEYLNTADLSYGSCFEESFNYSGDTTFQLLGDDSSPISAYNMIWGNEFFPRGILYIDPTPDSEYALYGVPANGSSFTHGNNYVEYDVTVDANKGWNVYGQYNLFRVESRNGGMVLIPNTTQDYTAYEEHIEKIHEKMSSGLELVFGDIIISATVNGTTWERTIRLKTKYDNTGDRKFFRSGIEIGDRRMWYKDGIALSQICTKVEDTPEGTYNSPSCWIDERTRVRVKTNVEFTEKLRKIIEGKESHLISITEAFADNGYTYPLVNAYNDTKKLAIASVEIINGEDVDVYGYLDYWNSIKEQDAYIDMQISAMEMKFDYMFEANNRLWACRYGEDYKGDFVNEIYASARGSFRSFYKFDNTADESYILSLGSSGAFTGVANFGGYPVFFKENYCHIIHGTYPSSFQLTTETGAWVASGSNKSVCVDDGVIYFHGKDGIYAYDGASKQKISEALGTDRYRDAVGGIINGKYYVSMRDSSDTYTLFVFDRASGMWHKEDSTQAVFFAPFKGDLYMVDNKYCISTINGSQGVLEGDVEWYAESGRIGFITPDSKYIGKIQLKMLIPVGSSIKVYIQYDSDGYWEFKGAVEGKNALSFNLPIMPRRCDHFSIKLSGKGECKVFSITKTYETGGE